MKKVKTINIDTSKCTGCRTCELVCSSYHYDPKHGFVNPARSRIKISYDEENSLYIPVIAGPHTVAECEGRPVYRIGADSYDECGFCPNSCPSREYFKEPDSGLPLRCDLCGTPPPPEGPLCVAWCQDDALTYSERDEEGELEEEDQAETSVAFLIRKYGLQKIEEILKRRMG